ncbi:MAG: transporter [Mariniphaga sp.]|nr:transporter [Mariniphaga sp.]
MKQLSIILFIFSCLSPHLFAQNKLHDRFSFSISGGAAIPVGTFGMKDISNAAIYYVPNSNDPSLTWIMGIDKSKSGFANVGYYYNAQFSYRMTNHVFLFLRAGQTKNSVQTSEISQFLTQKYGLQEFEEADYRIGSVTPGVGYTMSLNQWDISLGLFGGLARSNYPVYKSTFTNPAMIWTLEGEAPKNLFSFSSGGVLSLDRRFKRISAGIVIVYQHSSFKYDMTTHLSPGSSQVNPVVHDKLKVSLLTVGLQLDYSFGK